MTEPLRLVRSPDGTRIAVFSSGEGPPLILVHGATADHTTWRATAPILGRDHRLHAIDRRGRGGSGDAPDAYSITREYEDIAAVAEAVAGEAGGPVDVVGHSYGGRCALGAALLTASIRRVGAYEGAPEPVDAGRGGGYQPSGVELRIAALIDAGKRDDALGTFFGEVVRMPPAELAAYRENPVWPLRVAAVHTALRELEWERSPEASLDPLGGVRQPVLQILGGASAPIFREAIEALDARLAHGRTVVIPGARHAAHHTHVELFVAAIEAFLAGSGMAD